MMDEKELDRHMIMMQLYIPAESIMNMITSGILDPQVLLDMIEEVKKRNRFTGDEKKKKTFGNDFTDWNPDPNSTDYQQLAIVKPISPFSSQNDYTHEVQILSSPNKKIFEKNYKLLEVSSECAILLLIRGS